MPADSSSSATPNDGGGELKTLGKYTIQRKLGAGGMGTVYLAVDPSLNRAVALKVLPKERAENPILVRRFKAEGQAAAVLEHKNIIRVYDAGEADGYLYLALEYIDGIDVLEWMRKRGVIPVKRSLDIIRQMAEALKHAYSKNIVHRDIKPSNIMIARDGTAKLADMGLARSVDDTLDTSITRDGTTVGTVDYMAPEQAANSKAADIRSDIYSLGCTWYHMLVGSPPFNQGGVTEKLTAHARKAPPDPRERNDRVTEAMVAVLHRMMAKKQEDRYQNPEELLADLNNDSLTRGGSPANLLAVLIEDDSHFDMDHQSDRAVSPVEQILESSAESSTTSGRATAATPADSQPPTGQRKPTGAKPKRKTQAPQSQRQPAEEESAIDSTVETGPSQNSRVHKKVRVQPAEATTPTSVREQKVASTTESAPASSPSPKRKRSRTPTAQQEPAASGRKGAVRSSTPVEVSEQTPAHRRPAKQMPPRQGEVESPQKPKAAISVDFKKAGVVLLALGGLIVGGWWVVNSLTSSDTTNATPYANGNPPPGPPEEVVNDKPEISAEPAAPENMQANIDDSANAGASGNDPQGTAPTPATEVVAVDFPGLEAGDIDAVRLRELLPAWIIEGWALPKSESDKFITIERGKQRSQSSAYPTLQAGLQHVSVSPTTIELAGDSVFTSGSITVDRCQHLTIKAAANATPILHINGRNLDEAGIWLAFQKGTLELDGLHVVVTVPESQGEKITLFDLSAANLIVKNCSFTTVFSNKVSPTSSTGVTIAKLAGRSAQGNRIWWENSTVQGNRFTVFRTEAPQCEFVAGNCLFATTGANLFESELRDAAETTDQSRWSLLGCTCLTDQAAIQCAQVPAEADLPATSLALYRSLFAAVPTGRSTMIQFRNWPLGKATADLNQPLPENVTLNLQRSRFAGWSALSHMTDKTGEVHQATDQPSWRQFWRQSLPSDVLLPAIDQLPAEISSMQINEWTQALAELTNGGTAERGQWGAQLDLQVTLSPGFRERFQVAANRPRLPDAFGSGMPIEKTVRFDLARVEKLQEFLDSQECPDGTHVICVGAGLKRLPPITLVNRRLRIEFEQASGTPLILRPPGDSTGRALFTIEGGQFDLVNANVDLPDSRSKQYPATFVNARQGAHVSLRHCHCLGPPQGNRGVPLIELEETAEDAAYCAVSDCSLLSNGVVLAANMSGRVIELDNSLLVSKAAVLSLRSGEKPGSLLLHHCTLSAGASALQCSGIAQHAQVDLFVKNSVFAPGISADPEGITLLTIDDQQLLGDVFRWWEAGSAYSGSIAHCLRAGETVTGNQFDADWQERWGPGHVIDELSGAQAVTLQSVLSDLESVTAEQFTLQSSCEAASWSDDLSVIGINVKEIGPRTTPPKPEETDTPRTPSQSATTPQPRPSKKPKGPDF